MRFLLGIDTRFVRRLQRRARVVWRSVLIELVVLVVLGFGLLARLSESAEVAASVLVSGRAPAEQRENSAARRLARGTARETTETHAGAGSPAEARRRRSFTNALAGR